MRSVDRCCPRGISVDIFSKNVISISFVRCKGAGPRGRGRGGGAKGGEGGGSPLKKKRIRRGRVCLLNQTMLDVAARNFFLVYPVLPSFTEFYRVLPSFEGFTSKTAPPGSQKLAGRIFRNTYLVLPNFTEMMRSFLSLTGFSRAYVLRSS